ncbi:MAG: ORF6N domain-containing protein [Gallionella sp.]|nr:ORF6N domain-containing protein [Gallionella sp.]
MLRKKPLLLPGQIIEGIEGRIYSLRGQRVMLSHDLAALYQVETKVLMQAVRRSIERFPEDFAFKLTNQEFVFLRSQTVTSSWGGSRVPPHAFTEQGVAMLSSVLRSSRAVGVNIEIMRAFVKLRSLLESDKELSRKLDALEKKYDVQFQVVFEAIRELMTPPQQPRKKRIGFIQD